MTARWTRAITSGILPCPAFVGQLLLAAFAGMPTPLFHKENSVHHLNGDMVHLPSSDFDSSFGGAFAFRSNIGFLIRQPLDLPIQRTVKIISAISGIAKTQAVTPNRCPNAIEPKIARATAPTKTPNQRSAKITSAVNGIAKIQSGIPNRCPNALEPKTTRATNPPKNINSKTFTGAYFTEVLSTPWAAPPRSNQPPGVSPVPTVFTNSPVCKAS